jgi:hypothetical protein
MSEECASYDLVPNLKGIRYAVRQAIGQGFDPKTIAVEWPDPFKRVIRASKPNGVKEEWDIPDVWARCDSARYERDSAYGPLEAMQEYVRKLVKRYSAHSKV